MSRVVPRDKRSNIEISNEEFLALSGLLSSFTILLAAMLYPEKFWDFVLSNVFLLCAVLLSIVAVSWYLTKDL